MKYVHAVGSVVQVELTTRTGMAVHVEMSQERYQHLQLYKGAEVFVSIKEMQVFTDVSRVGGNVEARGPM